MLIGLTGPSGVGKTTLAKAWIKNGENRYRLPFALPLKRCVAGLLGINRDVLDDEKFKDTVIEDIGVSPRTLLQLIGTDCIRKCLGDDFWINLWLKSYRQIVDSLDVIVDDIRFENEASCIRQLGGTIIHVNRKNIKFKRDHDSEQGVKPYYLDYILQLEENAKKNLEFLEKSF